jgi:hypothetical protein
MWTAVPKTAVFGTEAEKKLFLRGGLLLFAQNYRKEADEAPCPYLAQALKAGV